MFALLGSTLALCLTALPAMAGELTNATAHIPPQCYTKAVDADGAAHNPCQTCHSRSRAPNCVNDHDLQLAYSFPAPARVNPWSNLFVDRSAEVAAPHPADLPAWVKQSNYFAEDGTPVLAARLSKPPADWDMDGDGRWSGFVPDAAFAFDARGFDRAPDGRLTGRRTFAYQPLPGTFRPANGATDDVLIGLPEAY